MKVVTFFSASMVTLEKWLSLIVGATLMIASHLNKVTSNYLD